MHEALTEPLHLAGAIVAVGHHGEVRVHAAVPAPVALDVAAGVVVLNVVALAGGAYEGAGAAGETGLVKPFPDWGIKIPLCRVGSPVCETQIFQGQLPANVTDGGLFRCHRRVIARLQQGLYLSGQRRSLFRPWLPVQIFSGKPGSNVALRRGAVDAEGSAEAGGFRPGTGQTDENTALTAGSIISIHGPAQEHLVQHGNATHVAGADAEDHEGLFPQGLRFHGELAVGSFTGIQVFALGEEDVLGGLHGFQRADIHVRIRLPQGEIGLPSSLHRQE